MVLVGLVTITRAHVGACNPVGVICGAAVGLAIGSAIHVLFEVTAKSAE